MASAGRDADRAANGMASLEEATEGRLTGEVVLNPVFMQAQQMKQQADMAAQQGAMGMVPGTDIMPGDHMDEGQGQPEDEYGGMEPQGPDQETDLSDLPQSQRAPGVAATQPGKGGGSRPGKKLGKSLTILVDSEDDDEDDEDREDDE